MQAIERTLWHPVVAAADVAQQPVAAVLLDEPLVLWRDGQGTVHAWADRCPHRGARLSLGQIVDGKLACPYHGWRFEAGGRCVHVPVQPAFVPPASHCAQVFEAQERQGLVWVRLAPPAPGLPDTLLTPPPFAEGEAAGWRQLLCGPYDVATSAPRLVENFLDLSHFGFVHEGWLGTPDHAQVDPGDVSESPEGVTVKQCKAWQPRAYADANEGAWIAYRYDVPAPYTAVLSKDATEEQGTRNAIALFICPRTPESCTAWFAMATFNDASSDDDLRRFQDAVFAQDKPIIESQQPKRLPVTANAPVREVHGPADRVSSAYRRYLARLGVTFGVC